MGVERRVGDPRVEMRTYVDDPLIHEPAPA